MTQPFGDNPRPTQEHLLSLNISESNELYQDLFDVSDQSIFFEFNNFMEQARGKCRWSNADAQTPAEANLDGAANSTGSKIPDTTEKSPINKANAKVLTSFTQEVCIKKIGKGQVLRGRGEICLCFDNRYVSVTVRKQGESQDNLVDQKTGLIKRRALVSEMDKEKELNQKAEPTNISSIKEPTPEEVQKHIIENDANHPIDLSSLATLLRDVILTRPAENHEQEGEQVKPGAQSNGSKSDLVRQGLVVFGGATSSGKSLYATEFIKKYIEKIKEPESNWPHYVSIEDFPEYRFKNNPFDALNEGIFYISQTRTAEENCFKYKLLSALRQKPAVVYVGEIREEADWPLILEFAATGHLVIATTHAGSLRGLMAKLMQSSRKLTPAERGELAGRVAGLVHLHPESKVYDNVVTNRPESAEVKIPSVWTGTPQSRAAFVRDGLSSILPHNDRQRRFGMTGKMWWLDTYRSHVEKQSPELYKALAQRLIQVDIEGQ